MECKAQYIFESFRIHHLVDVIAINVDKQNDTIHGYKWSMVLSMTKFGKRLTIHGYSRKNWKYYMKRLREAQQYVC